MNVRYRVQLSQAERDQLIDMLSGGKHAARKLKRAQLLLAADSGVRQPIPAAPGQPRRYDYQYRRNGTMNLFVFLDVHRPWRTVKVTEQRTAVDFTQCMRDLVDIHYPGADAIRVVVDNLSTHGPGALYEAFPAPEAHRILQRLEIHHTPKHASWLNMVELEIGVLRGQCLDRRIGDRKKLTSEIAAWVEQRNNARARKKRMFNTAKACKKLCPCLSRPRQGAIIPVQRQ